MAKTEHWCYSIPETIDFDKSGIPGTVFATHSIRAYTDSLIEFDINRDNATTSGSALICISGYGV